AAIRTLVGDHLALALAGGAGPRDGEEALGEALRAGAAADAAGLGPRPGFRSGALAGRADHRPRILHLQVRPEGRLLEADGAVDLQVGAPVAHRAAPRPGPEDLAEDVAEDVGEAAEGVEVEAAEAFPEGVARMPEAVVLRPLFRVREAGVRLGGLLELLLGLLVPGVSVGVVLQGELAVGTLDLLGGGVSRNAQDLVVVSLQVRALCRTGHAGNLMQARHMSSRRSAPGRRITAEARPGCLGRGLARSVRRRSQKPARARRIPPPGSPPRWRPSPADRRRASGPWAARPEPRPRGGAASSSATGSASRKAPPAGWRRSRHPPGRIPPPRRGSRRSSRRPPPPPSVRRVPAPAGRRPRDCSCEPGRRSLRPPRARRRRRDRASPGVRRAGPPAPRPPAPRAATPWHRPRPCCRCRHACRPRSPGSPSPAPGRGPGRGPRARPGPGPRRRPAAA